MKMNKLYLVLLLIISGAMITSCTNKNADIVSLELSEFGTLNISADGEKKVIQVTTNQKEWIANANAPWVEIEQNGSELTLSILKNELPAERKSSVLVLAGGAAKKIELVQAANKGKLYVSEESINFDQFAQNQSVRVVSNAGSWDVEVTDPSWIKVLPIVEDNKLQISVENNENKEARSGKIFVKSAGEVREISINQSGKVLFLLPLLTPGADVDAVKDFETARRSRLVLDKNYLTGGGHTYKTISPLFPKIEYNFSNDKIYEINMYPDDVLTLTSEDFHNFLLENGFESKGDNGQEKPYIKSFKVGDAGFEIRVQILYAVSRQPKVVKFLLFSKQPKKMPTYSELPKGPNNISTGTKADVFAWEASNGGTLSQSKSTDNYYYFEVLDKTYIGRYYFFSEDGSEIKEMRFFTYDISKVFYMAGENNYQMTDEFKALLEREGYTDPYLVNDKFKKLYRNKENGSVLGVRVARINEVNGGAPVVEFMYLPISIFDQQD